MPKINVSLPVEVVAGLDAAAAELGITRSEYIRRATDLYARYLALERMVEEHKRQVAEAVRSQDELAERAAEYVA